MMVLAFLPLIMSAAAVVPHLEPPIPGYGIAELSWEVIPAPGQSPVILNGTIEQVHSQLLEINSNYQAEVSEKQYFTPTREDLLAAPTAASPPTVTAHSTQIFKINCGGYESADIGQIKQGIDYLNSVAGQPSNGPGPNNCGRDTSPKALPGFYSIATGATKIVNACPGGNNQTVAGTADHPDNWTVVVKGDIC